MKGYFVYEAPFDCVNLKFSYDVEALARIKALPNHLRSWDGASKQWELDEETFDESREFLFPTWEWKCIYDERVPQSEAQNDFRSSSTPPCDYDVLWLKQGAPKEVVKAAYSALIRIHHPDVGGDEETAKQINAAYARLKNEAL